MNNCIVLVTDINYVNHIKSLINQIKEIGKWDGDICVIFNNIVDETLKNQFLEKKIKILDVNFDNPFYGKFKLFDTFFKKWDNIIYMDVDFIIKKEINPLLKQITDKNILLVDFEKTNIKDCLDKNNENYPQLNQKYQIETTKVFNSGCMVYPTTIINENTYSNLNDYAKDLKLINNHTKVVGGTDQPILNIFFKNITKQISGIRFHLNNKGDEIALHTCRWHAPWKDSRYLSHYTKYLNKW